MLQTRTSRRLCALGLIVLSMCMRASIAESQPRRSCTNTLNTVRSYDVTGQSGLPEGEIFEKLEDEPALNGVCKLDKTCCSQMAECSFKTATVRDYHRQVQDMLVSALMPCHNHSIVGELAKYIRLTKSNLVSNMQHEYGVYFSPYTTIFDEFYGYLENSIWTGNLCQVEELFTKVSYEMFLAAFIVTDSLSGAPSVLPNTKDFHTCFFDYFVDLQGDTVLTKLNGFLRTFNHTMRYVRALKMIDMVIEGILDLPLTRQCQNALMKMTYCSQCAGYNSDLLPCQGLCMNSLRGCLIDLADLVVPVREASEAMIRLKKELSSTSTSNQWDQITLLSPYFFQIIDSTRVALGEIKRNVFLRCDANGARNRRSATTDVGDGSRKVEEVRERRFITKKQAPSAPITEMNDSSYCIGSTFPVFNSLPDRICNGTDISKGNTQCWTGGVNGSYERTVLDLNRADQRDNPELVVFVKQSRVEQQIAQLKYITRELDIITGTFSCTDDDDEDCTDTVPDTCDYFDFPDSYDYVFEFIDSGSGSGSGSGSESAAADDEEEDVCATVEGETEGTSSVPNTTVGDTTGSAAAVHTSMILLTSLVLVSLVWALCRGYL